MKCPVCSEKELKSRVFVGMSTSTLMYCTPYYDEDGIYHSHDSNTHSTNYNCSNGHVWIESSTGFCPSCDFGKDSNQVKILNDKETPMNAFGISGITLTDDSISIGGNALTFMNESNHFKII